MRRILTHAVLTLSIFLASPARADEKVVVSTFYPAPWGEYNELRAKKTILGSVGAPDVDPADTLTVYGDVQVNSRVNVGSPGPALGAPEGYYLQGQPFSGGGGGIRQVLTAVGTSAMPNLGPFSDFRPVPEMRKVITTQSNAYLMISADIAIQVWTGACAFEIRVDGVRVAGTFTGQGGDPYAGRSGITTSAVRIAPVGPGRHVVDMRYIANDNHGAATDTAPLYYPRTLTVAEFAR